MLCHLGQTHTEHNLHQHFYWKGLRTTVNNLCKKCPTCQTAKTTNQKYGNLPPKKAETNPCNMLCVYLIFPYMIPLKRKKPLKLWCLAMIDTATGWFDMTQIHKKLSAEITDIAEITWFTHYPLPQRIFFDSVTKFMAESSKMYQNDYGIKRKPITTSDPKYNAIIERIHQNIGNIIRTFGVYNIVNNNPWSGILATTMFAIRATYHTTLQGYPMQLLFGQDAVLNIKHIADWEHIRQQKHEQINRNNKHKNMCRNNHQYKLGDKILVKRKKNSKHEI